MKRSTKINIALVAAYVYAVLSVLAMVGACVLYGVGRFEASAVVAASAFSSAIYYNVDNVNFFRRLRDTEKEREQK